jgi:hypothetical protein
MELNGKWQFGIERREKRILKLIGDKFLLDK